METTNAKTKGLYLVSESACLLEGSGANKHITAGLIQLQKYFDIELLLLCKEVSLSAGEQRVHIVSKKNNFNKFQIGAKIKRTVKWFFLIIKNHLHFFRYYHLIRKQSPRFIYERLSYLNFNGLIIAKLLKIPHAYEVNGILSNDNAKYFPHLLNRISFWLEKKCCKHTFGFYVGGINDILDIPRNKSLVIQNGVDYNFARKFETKVNTVKTDINIVFVGHAMSHHRLDILVNALKIVKHPSRFHLHLIGSNLEFIKRDVPRQIKTTLYGILNQDKIAELMKDFHIGIIPYSLPYFSHVKVFMYGAAKLAIILPSVKNFKTIFTEEEVIFTTNGDPEDIARRLENIVANPNVLRSYGEKIYSKVCEKYTWERIYFEIAGKIEDFMKNNTFK